MSVGVVFGLLLPEFLGFGLWSGLLTAMVLVLTAYAVARMIYERQVEKVTSLLDALEVQVRRNPSAAAVATPRPRISLVAEPAPDPTVEVLRRRERP